MEKIKTVCMYCGLMDDMEVKDKYVRLDGRRPPKEEIQETGRDGPPEQSAEAHAHEKQETKREEERSDGGETWEQTVLRIYRSCKSKKSS